MTEKWVPESGRPDPAQIEPLWDRVDRNRWLVVRWLTLFAAVMTALCSASFGLLGFLMYVMSSGEGALGAVGLVIISWSWVLALGLTLAYMTLALSRPEKSLAKVMGAELVPTGELTDQKMALKDMAIAAGLPHAPAMYLIEFPSTNAFAVASPNRRPVIGITRGFITKLTVDEQRAVFANLMARLVTGSIFVSTAQAALMRPLHAMRDAMLNQSEDEEMRLAIGPDGESEFVTVPRTTGMESAAIFLALPLMGIAWPLLVLFGEVIAAAARRSQLRNAEKADAEGMLLLKDPKSMLDALESVVVLWNCVPSAGEGLADLFYCWTGVSPNDESDPEWERVKCLREVLGVEGHVPRSVPTSEAFASAPSRLDG
jgi:Zn-dependent protease with chaperone function